MDDPYKELAGSLREQIAGYTRNAVSGITSELGTITATGVKLDQFKHEIQDYLVADFPVTLKFPAFHLLGTTTSLIDAEGNPLGESSQRMRFDFEESEIEDVNINLAAGLKPGDRVVVLNCNGGKDVIVMCRVVSSGG
ncbi:hypothetical protein SAMN04488542_102261 [Fontibacillus panacisegetis]|uniref:Uncharacterized protein n=1 Tax=Fontibacillus panacisegetis TaxID=670482 RepID=A0A1G7G226_9BACL|nr:hypothetical protein [Fontibacillus panacisegetis]SDE82191.1 hypothetical protein SAMN04488542_102261 [Fontibacillus panacisegetis]